MRNQIKTIVLLGVLSAALIGFGGILGKSYLVAFTAVAVIFNLGAWFWSDKLVLKLHKARELDPSLAPALHRLVSELAMRAEVPKPRVFLIPSAQPNAFATGRTPEKGVVAVTTGILELLSERELRGVIAHELAHIKNRDVLIATIAAAIAGAMTWIANALQFSALFGSSSEDEAPSPIGMLLLAVTAPLAAGMIQMSISRAREYLADETGARISGDPEALARALEKLERAASRVPAEQPVPATASLFIVNPFGRFRSFMNLFSTHPPVAERVRRLRAMQYDVGLAA